MKIIEKLHLVNWHYIKYKTININKEINLISGNTGSGKSTIVDAIQLLVMGDSKANYFNKAANEKSKRTVLTYLMGMNNVEETGERTYLRNEDFTSYIVMQTVDTVKNKRFCVGVIYEVTVNTLSYERQWFFLDRELPKDGFVVDGEFQTISNFRDKYYKKGSDILFETESDYRSMFRSPKIMGNLRGDDFYTVFKNAVSFNQTNEIRSFIENFLADNESMDIEGMKQNIKAYKKMEENIKNIEEQIVLLDGCNEIYTQYRDFENKIKGINYGFNKIEFLNAEKVLNKEKETSNNLETIINQLKEEIEALDLEVEKAEEVYDEKYKELVQAESDTNKDSLELELKIVEQALVMIKSHEDSLCNKIKIFIKWQEFIKNKDAFEIEYDEEEIRFINDSISALENHIFDENSLEILCGKMLSLKEKIDRNYHNLTNQMKVIGEKLTAQNLELVELREGLKNYDKNLIDFKNEIENELEKRKGKKIEVHILADLLEINDESWSKSIEGYLRNAKFNLIIEPKYYEDAYKIYNKLDPDKYSGYSLVDIERIQQQKFKVKQGSLAEEIITDNNYARVYINYLLRGVIKCYDIENIRDNPISITKECALYKDFLFTRINKKYTSKGYIGKKSIKNNIERLNNEIKENEIKEEELKRRLGEIQKYIKLKIVGSEKYEIDELIQHRNNIKTKEDKLAEKAKIIEKINSIDLTYVFRLRNELNEYKKEKESVKKEREEKNIDLGVKEESRQNLIHEVIPEKISTAEGIRIKLDIYDVDFKNSPYCKDLDGRIENSIEKYKSFRKIEEELAEEKIKYEEHSEKQFKALMAKRKKLLQDYGIDKGLEAKTNDEYQRLCNNLKENRLPEYKEDIKNQKEKAHQQFSSELLLKLKDSIKKAFHQRDLLNNALKKFDFGKDVYAFKIKAAPKYEAYFDMLTDDTLDIDPLSQYQHSNKYSQIIEDLFDEITEKGETLEEQMRVRKNIEKFTNYKTYLYFDMTCVSTDANGEKKPTSIAGSFDYNSGGETQNPFLITLLSAFKLMYQMDAKSKDETMRLVVFDEAFNKMDGDRVESSINLARKMGFQVIIVAPSDKIPLIAPNVNEVIYVEAKNKEKIIVSEFTEKKDIDSLIEMHE